MIRDFQNLISFTKTTMIKDICDLSNFFNVVIKYILMYILYNKKILNNVIHLSNTSRIYRKNPKLKKIILFLSGALQISYTCYINKIISDIIDENLFTEYDLCVYEDVNKTSLDLYEDITNCINNIKPKEIVIIGFSSGGVVGSHILSMTLKCKKKLITIDTPYHIIKNINSYYYRLYRLDIIFYLMAIYSFNKKDRIKYFSDANIFNGTRELCTKVKKRNNYGDKKLDYLSSFNINNDDDIEVISYISKNDPFVCLETHKKYFNKIRNKIKFRCNIYITNTKEHITEILFSKEYLFMLKENI